MQESEQINEQVVKIQDACRKAARTGANECIVIGKTHDLVSDRLLRLGLFVAEHTSMSCSCDYTDSCNCKPNVSGYRISWAKESQK